MDEALESAEKSFPDSSDRASDESVSVRLKVTADPSLCAKGDDMAADEDDDGDGLGKVARRCSLFGTTDAVRGAE